MVNVMAEQISSLGALAMELLISKIVWERTSDLPPPLTSQNVKFLRLNTSIYKTYTYNR